MSGGVMTRRYTGQRDERVTVRVYSDMRTELRDAVDALRADEGLRTTESELIQALLFRALAANSAEFASSLREWRSRAPRPY